VEEMLKTLYEDVAITIHNCTPQPSANGCISLLVTGYFIKKVIAILRVYSGMINADQE